MGCPTCKKAHIVPTCLTALTLGAISTHNAAVYIYFRRVSNNRLERLEATSSNAGVVIATFADLSEFFAPKSQYEVWVTLQSALDIYDRETLTISADTAVCLLVTWEKVLSTIPTTQSITLE